MKIFTKESIINELKKIKSKGWIPNARHGNAGGVGNTLEDLLGIEENNLPIPNASEWELKCQRKNTTSLITLFHMEPSPRAFKFVPNIFLPKYGWQHSESGIKYAENEMSFRQTISGQRFSDRGFKVVVDRSERKVMVSFDSKEVDIRHANWLNNVKNDIGLGELDPQPYWGFDDLRNKAGTKLLNCFFIQADVKKEKGKELFLYSDIMILRDFSIECLLSGIKEGFVYIDFDARTGHNHGTKFRLPKNKIPLLYENKQII